MVHILHSWKQYLTKDNYTFLLQFVENAKNHIPNEKVLILSGIGRNGKTTLMHEIMFYIGSQYCYECNEPQCGVFKKSPRQMVLIHGGIEYFKHDNENTKQLLDLIEKQRSIICDTSKLDLVDPFIFDKAYIINMKHIF